MYRLMRVFQTSLFMVVAELRSLAFVTLKSTGSKIAGIVSSLTDNTCLLISPLLGMKRSVYFDYQSLSDLVFFMPL